jgi:hypothetical protein
MPPPWDRHTDDKYGICFRFPRVFKHWEGQAPPGDSNFVNQGGAVLFEKLEIPRETYPKSNFSGGSFTAIVNPTIRSEGTCSQFSTIWPEHTSVRTIQGISYAQTVLGSTGLGSSSAMYYFHTYQNGLCYEFVYEFSEANYTGMMLTRSVQWVSEKNEFELMDALLKSGGKHHHSS